MSQFPRLSLRQRNEHRELQTPFINSRKTSLWQPRSPPRSPVRSSRLCKAPMTSFTKAVLLLLVAIIVTHDKTQRLRLRRTMAADRKQITNCCSPGVASVIFVPFPSFLRSQCLAALCANKDSGKQTAQHRSAAARGCTDHRFAPIPLLRRSLARPTSPTRPGASQRPRPPPVPRGTRSM